MSDGCGVGEALRHGPASCPLLVVGGTQCFRAHLESEGHGDASIRKFRTGKDAAVEVGKGGAHIDHTGDLIPCLTFAVNCAVMASSSGLA